MTVSVRVAQIRLAAARFAAHKRHPAFTITARTAVIMAEGNERLYRAGEITESRAIELLDDLLVTLVEDQPEGAAA